MMNSCSINLLPSHCYDYHSRGLGTGFSEKHNIFKFIHFFVFYLNVVVLFVSMEDNYRSGPWGDVLELLHVVDNLLNTTVPEKALFEVMIGIEGLQGANFVFGPSVVMSFLSDCVKSKAKYDF